MSDSNKKEGLDSESTPDSDAPPTRCELDENCDQKGMEACSTEDVSSEFGPTDLVKNPEITIEEYEDPYEYRLIPSCSGRGTETASVRGYNTERLASAVFSSGHLDARHSPNPSWLDTFTSGSSEVGVWNESKSCINRYPSGSYGRFKIWKHHHDKFVEDANWHPTPMDQYLYFFLVYKIVDGMAKEVGKLAAPANQIDEILDSWTVREHQTMGERQARDISWNLLLKRLGVPKSVFREQPIVDLSDGVPSGSSDD